MGSKGSQTSTTNQSQNSTYIPTGGGYLAGALNNATNLNNQGAPTIPTAPVAGFSDLQNSALQGYGGLGQISNPFTAQAQNYFSPQGAQQFFNPFADAVTAQMQNIFGQQQQQNNANLVQSAGGVGADRIAVGQGNLANQQGLAAGQTLAGLYSQAQQQAQQAGQNTAALGFNAQNAAQSALGAQFGAGQQQQQLQQQQLNAPYQQQLAQQALPYQLAQWYSQQAGALAPALGGSTYGSGTGTTTSQYDPSIFSQLAQIGGLGLGLGRGLGKGSGGAVPYASGGIVNPFADGGPVDISGGLLTMPTLLSRPSQIIPQTRLSQAQSHVPQVSLNLNPQQPNMQPQGLQGLQGLMALGKSVRGLFERGGAIHNPFALPRFDDGGSAGDGGGDGGEGGSVGDGGGGIGSDAAASAAADAAAAAGDASETGPSVGNVAADSMGLNLADTGFAGNQANMALSDIGNFNSEFGNLDAPSSITAAPSNPAEMGFASLNTAPDFGNLAAIGTAMGPQGNFGPAPSPSIGTGVGTGNLNDQNSATNATGFGVGALSGLGPEGMGFGIPGMVGNTGIGNNQGVTGFGPGSLDAQSADTYGDPASPAMASPGMSPGMASPGMSPGMGAPGMASPGMGSPGGGDYVRQLLAMSQLAGSPYGNIPRPAWLSSVPGYGGGGIVNPFSMRGYDDGGGVSFDDRFNAAYPQSDPAPYRDVSPDAMDAWRSGVDADRTAGVTAQGDDAQQDATPLGYADAAPNATRAAADDAAPGLNRAALGYAAAATPPASSGNQGYFSKLLHDPLSMALIMGGLSATTPQGFSGGFQQGLQLMHQQESADLQAKRLEQEANFHADQYTKLTAAQKADLEKPPTGYEYTDDKNMRAIPHGPADPEVITATANAKRGSGMTDSAVDFRARMWVQGNFQGAMAGVGRGVQGSAAMDRIANRTTQMLVDEQGMSEADAAKYVSNQMQQFKAAGVGLNTEARTTANREANLNLILKATEAAIPAALEASRNLERTGWVPLNRIIQAGQVIASDPKLKVFGMANLQLAEHWARAMNPTGVMRESDRDKALGFLETADSSATYERVVQQLLKQITRERDAVHGGGGNASPAASGAAAPQGKTVVRQGTVNSGANAGKKIIEYSDGTREYQ